MAVVKVEHPLIEDVLTSLRDSSTPHEEFRRLTRKLSRLLVFEASRDLPLREVDVETPLETTRGGRLDADIVLVPVLRAGMGMLEALLEVFPGASIGYVGLERDEETAVARRYYLKLPNLPDRYVFLLDPIAGLGSGAGRVRDIRVRIHVLDRSRTSQHAHSAGRLRYRYREEALD